MVLGRALTDAAGRTHRMADLLPLETSFAACKLQLGYRSAMLLGNGPLGRAGSAFRGHEFHYATVLREDGVEKLCSVSNTAGIDLGIADCAADSVFGSFIHLIDGRGPWKSIVSGRDHGSVRSIVDNGPSRVSSASRSARACAINIRRTDLDAEREERSRLYND